MNNFEVEVGSTTYTRGEYADPHEIGGSIENFILLDDQDVPIYQNQGNGQTFWCHYKKQNTAETRAREISGLGGVEIRVFDKTQGEVIFAVAYGISRNL